jgi:homoserine kinase type II
MHGIVGQALEWIVPTEAPPRIGPSLFPAPAAGSDSIEQAMAVFTEVPHSQAAALVAQLELGHLHALRGIVSGIENSNFFVDCERDGVRREYVLTVFERLSFEQLPFYLRLMKHLAGKGIPVPEPQADASDELLHSLCGKPAAVVSKLEGAHELAPQPLHVQQVGAMLARMHLAAADFTLQQPHLRGLPWWQETVPQVLPFLQAPQAQRMREELAYQTALAASPAYVGLPRGPIHADLFRDNVMFQDGRLSGLFDFYFAGVDTLLFDIAVCLNDWCIDLASGRLTETQGLAFLEAYAAVRPLTATEQRLLPDLLRAAALRFWLSRLWDLHLPRDAQLLKAHDPGHFERVLAERIERPWPGVGVA